ncbi:MAG: hypothetical protein GQ574_11960 [Crocinitomix sp.]|nr:hypothetical protein [Crocinitomix sp.]
MSPKSKTKLPSKIQGLINLSAKGIAVPKFEYLLGDLKTIQFQVKVLLNSLKIPVTGLSIRSASYDEDTKTNSNAGKYLSFNNLQTFDAVLNAAIAIIKDFQTKNKTTNPCHILIQDTVASMYSGVTFASYDNDSLKVYTESFYGSCRSVVDGMTTPYVSEYENGKWQHRNNTGDFFHQFIIHPSLFDKTNLPSIESGSRLETSLVDFPERMRYFVSTIDNEIHVYGHCPLKAPDFFIQKLSDLLSIASSFKTEYPKGVDIEWGIDKTGQLYLFQIRDLTSPIVDLGIKTDSIEIKETGNLIKGTPASKGDVKGYVVYGEAEVNLPKGAKKILMLTEANVDNTEKLETYDGVICTYGGMLSHLAIVCREFRIPCIVGAGSIIPEMTFVAMDCNKGIIKLNEDV